MRIYAGRTMLRPDHSRSREHLWVILTEPSGKPATVAAVNFTSNGPAKDQTVRLAPGDHPFIGKDTVVFYAIAQILTTQELEEEVREGRSTFHVDCSEDLLQTVRDGLQASAFTPRNVKTYVAERI